MGAVVGIAPQVLRAAWATPAGSNQELPYECGFEAFEDARMKFDVRYYLVAILSFFSIWRSRFCFPGRWRSGKSGRQVSQAMMIFLGILVGGCLRVEKGRPGWE